MDAHQFNRTTQPTEREHTMHASTLPDIIAATPVMLGYVPNERAVMVVSKDDRLFGALAIDIPATADDAVKAVTTMTKQALNVGAERVFLFIFTKREAESGVEFNMGLLALGFQTHAERSGLSVEGMASVTSSHWRDYHDPEHEHPLTDITDSELAAKLVSEGHNLQPVGDTIPEPDKASMTLTLAALNFRGTLPHMDPDDLSDRDRRMLRDAWDLWSGVFAAQADMTEREATDLMGYFQHPLFRDMFLTSLVREELDIDAIGTALRAILDDPQVEWLAHAKKLSLVLRELLRWTEPGLRPNILATLGFVEWFMGHGTYSHQCFQAVRDIDPTHRLGMLLATVCATKGLSKAISMPGAEPFMKIVNDHA